MLWWTFAKITTTVQHFDSQNAALTFSITYHIYNQYFNYILNSLFRFFTFNNLILGGVTCWCLDYIWFSFWFSLTGIDISECGIFINGVIGESPDSLLSLKNYLLEIKTRSLNASAPLDHVEKYQYMQCQFQMHCSGREYTVLMSYHPESNSANYFLV